jgi:SAM-dependent methyltransferase
VLSGIERAFPHLALYGSEIFSAGLAYAARRLNSAELFQMDARQIPFENEFDVIGAFDVLEHVKDDGVVLQQMHQALCAGGGLLVTVPQHPLLWSHLDEYACHVRRYTRKELRRKVVQAIHGGIPCQDAVGQE